MASKEEVLHYVLHGLLFQIDVTLSFCMLKLVDKECWEKEVVYPVPTSFMEGSIVHLLL